MDVVVSVGGGRLDAASAARGSDPVVGDMLESRYGRLRIEMRLL